MADSRNLLVEAAEQQVRKLTQPWKRFTIALSAVFIVVGAALGYFTWQQHQTAVQACTYGNSRAHVDQETWDTFLGLLITHSTDVTPGDKEVVAKFERKLSAADAPHDCGTGWL